MYKILEARELAEKTYMMVVEAPNVAHACEPGQFLIVRADEESERIALTICDYDRKAQTVTIVFQTIGESSYKIAEKKTGDSFADVVGPLGNPAEYVKEPIEEVRKRHYLLVGGGLGTAPVYPQAKWLKEHGVDVDVIIGTKSHDTLIMEKEMIDAVGAEHVFVTTDDGSYARSGMVT
ncbi:MAG: NAD-binding oxidoreductase, partial [Lachnospiraceae bacterium]|nr:NAD-binding oxidoreductase [Lachnospiraceae bacterium]